MFANEYYNIWVTASKSEILPGTWYNNVQRTWLRSGNNPTSSALSLSGQYLRSGVLQDPLISMSGWSSSPPNTLYAGNNDGGNRKAPYEGMDVYIR